MAHAMVDMNRVRDEHEVKLSKDAEDLLVAVGELARAGMDEPAVLGERVGASVEAEQLAKQLGWTVERVMQAMRELERANFVRRSSAPS